MHSAFSIHLPCDEKISWRARSEFAWRLNGTAAEWPTDVHLLVSELVTNGFEHGRPDEDGRIELDARRPEPDDEASFGLVLVDRMSDRWGFDVAGGRTRVWFEVGAV